MTQGYRGQVAPVIWSIDFDGKSVIELMEQWQKMPYNDVKFVISAEGGFIDDKGIIHRGKAKSKGLVTID